MTAADQPPKPGATPEVTPDVTADAIELPPAGPLEAGRLIEQNLSRLQSFLRLRSGPLLRSQESLSDLAQSVCGEILGKADQLVFESVGAFRYWLFLTAERKLIERHRYYTRDKRDVRRTVASETPGELPQHLAAALSPSADASLREQLVLLESAFDRLAPEHPEYQDVILMVHVAGLSHREAAERLGRSEQATRKLLSRALARLARLARSPRA